MRAPGRLRRRRAGHALRGGAAWGDINLYLRRDGERLLMSIEHRASASSGGIELTLGERGGGLSLHVREDIAPPAASPPATPAERVLGALSGDVVHLLISLPEDHRRRVP